MFDTLSPRRSSISGAASLKHLKNWSKWKLIFKGFRKVHIFSYTLCSKDQLSLMWVYTKMTWTSTCMKWGKISYRKFYLNSAIVQTIKNPFYDAEWTHLIVFHNSCISITFLGSYFIIFSMFMNYFSLNKWQVTGSNH